MKHLVNQIRVLQNLGWLDRTIRVVVSMALIGAGAFSASSGLAWPTYALLFAIYPLLTGIIGYDPVYSQFKIRSCGLAERNQCGTFPYEIDAALGHHPIPGSDIEHSLEHSHHSTRKA